MSRFFRLAVLAILIVLGLPACTTLQANRPPKAAPGEEAFFECSKCQSLYGGIFGRNQPMLSYESSNPVTCRHDWQRLPARVTFTRRFEQRSPGRLHLIATGQPPSLYWISAEEELLASQAHR